MAQSKVRQFPIQHAESFHSYVKLPDGIISFWLFLGDIPTMRFSENHLAPGLAHKHSSQQCSCERWAWRVAIPSLTSSWNPDFCAAL